MNLSETEKKVEVIEQRNIILQKREFEKAVDRVYSVKDEIKTTFGEILKNQVDIKSRKKVEPNQANQVNITKEV